METMLQSDRQTKIVKLHIFDV